MKEVKKALSSIFSEIYEQLLEEEVRKRPLPQHIGIIMDGNRRFARKVGREVTYGHILGSKKLEEVLRWCYDLGIKVVTVYAFSTENFKRSREEVKALMDLFERKFKELTENPDIHKNRVRVRAIGKLEYLPERVRNAIKIAEEATRDYSNYFLNVAIAYGGRDEIINAIRKIAEEVRRGELSPEEINEEIIKRHLYTGNLPDPDLIIRTSGEERLSNFLLWQSAYSELYFVEAYWPEFSRMDLLRAIYSYQKRSRRFGR